MRNDMKDKYTGFSTQAIHAGQEPDPVSGAVMTPIYQTSTFAQQSPGVTRGYDYSRSGNPTRTALEANLAALERGKHGVCFASGCAAADAVLHMLSTGGKVLCGDDVYGGTFRIFDKVFKHHGVTAEFVDLASEKSIDEAFKDNWDLVWIETPTNPLLKVVDIEFLAGRAHKNGAKLVVDNTFASPYLQNPLSLGADIVLHSATKYIGGHSDVVGGVLVVNDDELSDRLRFLQNAVGAVPGPLDMFLLLRSTKTLAVRMERHCENALILADLLEKRDDIEWIRYPGLPSHPQFELAKRQMKAGGGMITLELKGGLDRARKFLELIEIFTLAESLGGVESLVEHPAIMTHASIPKEQREALGISDGLVRISVGIEDVADLKTALVGALDESAK
jgi:cystathionine gamma-lyase